MKSLILILIPVILLLYNHAGAQNAPVHPSVVITGTLTGLSKPLRNLSPVNLKNAEVRKQSPSTTPGTILNFDGQNGETGSYFDDIAPSFNGVAGPDHYVQMVSSTWTVYSKTGTLLAGPVDVLQLFGVAHDTAAGAQYREPLVNYDWQAHRFVACCGYFRSNSCLIMIAVSQTADPLGAWYTYTFNLFPGLSDSPKLGVWHDGYYMAFSNSGQDIADMFVFQRDSMLVGRAAKAIGFKNPWRPVGYDPYMVVPPVTTEGTQPPPGFPGLFIGMNDGELGGGTDQLWLYELSVNWTDTSASVFNRVQQLDVQPFNGDFVAASAFIPQKGTKQLLYPAAETMMNAPQYRNFGSYQSIVCCHTVNLGTRRKVHAGIRWYELRKNTGGQWAIRQQNTYCPDSLNRWVGSIAINGRNKISLGYSVSGPDTYPSVRFCGQNTGAYTNAYSFLDIQEDTVINAEFSQTWPAQWGYYSRMAVDPSDDSTFWYTNQYTGPGHQRKSRIASFIYRNYPSVITNKASSIKTNGGTLNGKIIPNGLPTTSYFEWGTTKTYGNSSTVQQNGNGLNMTDLQTDINDLIPGVPYHFRLVGVNRDGTTYGNDMHFIPGGALVTTNPVSSITMTTATSGGNISIDGGAPVTQRGMCWSQNLKPTISDAHTSDGADTGTFISTLTGLLPATDYHLRAYATNWVNTWYGPEITFSTLCAIYPFPFTETFDSQNIPDCWTKTDIPLTENVWQFGTLPYANPSPALSGNYAFAYGDSYNYTQDGDLISPVLDCSAFTDIAVQFDYYFTTTIYSQRIFSFSIDGGREWFDLKSFNTIPENNPARYYTEVPEAAGQPQVRFRWNYIDQSDIGYWAVDNITVSSRSGIRDTGKTDLKVFPNPSNGSFSIAPIKGQKEELSVTVENMSGQVMRRLFLKGSGKYTVDLRPLQGGVYLLRIQTDTWVIEKKIVINP